MAVEISCGVPTSALVGEVLAAAINGRNFQHPRRCRPTFPPMTAFQ